MLFQIAFSHGLSIIGYLSDYSLRSRRANHVIATRLQTNIYLPSPLEVIFILGKTGSQIRSFLSLRIHVFFAPDDSMASSRDVDHVGSFYMEQVLGMGRTGLVVRQGQLAIKIPLKWDTSSEEQVESNIESLQHEQSIYKRLGKCDGIVPVLNCSETATTLRLMENGDLRSYLSQNKPSRDLQLSWFRTMARTLAYIHERRIIVTDIASRNFLLDSDLSIVFCDFTESIDLPLDACMETADSGGYSIRTDIGQLGCVMYEVVVGEKCAFDIWKDVPPELDRGRWPRREDLPSTQGVWLGAIIDKCWTEGAFNTALDLCRELGSVGIENEPGEMSRPSRKMLSMVQLVTASYRQHSFCYTTTLAITLGAITIYTWSRRHN